MILKDFSQCRMCKHEHPPTRGMRRTCVAFPEGIPREILGNNHLHEQPYEGDNGILFELREGADPGPYKTYEEIRARMAIE